MNRGNACCHALHYTNGNEVDDAIPELSDDPESFNLLFNAEGVEKRMQEPVPPEDFTFGTCWAQKE